MADELSRNLARLMVRRHLRAWVENGPFSEDHIIRVFIEKLYEMPDAKFKVVAGATDLALRQQFQDPQIVRTVPTELPPTYILTPGED